MPRAILLGDVRPYQFFGTFAGLPFWPGGLTLLAAAPGIGKTSWLLRMVCEAASHGVPSALGCYEHTAEELEHRRRRQAEAMCGGAHLAVKAACFERQLAQSSHTVFLALADEQDTVHMLEESLLLDYGFPPNGPAVLAVDYLQRVPVMGITGLVGEERRGGEAAAALRTLARRRGWAVIAAAALRGESFQRADQPDLASLLGDERVAYEPDRILLLSRRESLPCGCCTLSAATLKDRTGPLITRELIFYGERFFPTLLNEDTEHNSRCSS